MSASSDGRLLTGQYGWWRGVRLEVFTSGIAAGVYYVESRAANAPWDGWKDVRDANGNLVYRRASVPVAEVTDVVDIEVMGTWREHPDVQVSVDVDPGDGRWTVMFYDSSLASAHGLSGVPGVEGDWHLGMWGTVNKGYVEGLVSKVWRYSPEQKRRVGDPDQRWEYGPLG